MGADEDGSDARQLLHVLPQCLRAERAIESDGERTAVRDRVPEGLGGLPGQRAAACVGDGSRDHHRNPESRRSSKTVSIAKMAAFAFSVSKIVSTRRRSAPPSSRPRAASP